MQIIGSEQEIMKVCDLNADNLNNLKRIRKLFLKNTTNNSDGDQRRDQAEQDQKSVPWFHLPQV